MMCGLRGGPWAARGSQVTPLSPQGDFPLKAERVIQSVMAICNALAAVETPEITAALNQMPPCPSRMQPKIQKVRDGHGGLVLGVQDRGARPGGAKGKNNFTSDSFPPSSRCTTWKIPQ